jgi:flagellar hook-associated protein FlgK
MNIINALSTGILGIQRGLAQAQQSASTIASTDSMTSDHAVDLAEPMVNLMQARNQVEASARVVETIDEMLGTVIDVMA